jgi:hypothetical protein
MEGGWQEGGGWKRWRRRSEQRHELEGYSRASHARQPSNAESTKDEKLKKAVRLSPERLIKAARWLHVGSVQKPAIDQLVLQPAPPSRERGVKEKKKKKKSHPADAPSR